MSWPKVVLGSLVDIKTGRLDANAAVEGGEYPFFTCSRNPLLIDEYAFDVDAILVAGNGDLNVKHYRGKFNAYQRTYVVVVNETTKLDSRYLYYFMEKYVERLRELSIGGVIKYIKLGMLTEAEIPLPPLPEQKRIAAILDKADVIRRKRQQAIQLADEFLRSVFLDMFGDPVTNPKKLNTHVLSELVNVVSGATPSKENESFWIGNFPWISPKDMKTVEISESIDHVSEKVFELTNLKKLPARSILIVVRGMILAHTVPIGITKTEVSINQDIKAFVCGEKILPEFFLWCLKSQHDYLLSKVSNAAHGTKRFEMEDILSLKVILPDIEQQSNFVRIRNKFINTISAINTSKLASTDLCSSISQKAFVGQL